MKNIQLSPFSLVAVSAATAGLFAFASLQGTLTTERNCANGAPSRGVQGLRSGRMG